jgi:uncharacterized membrane protein HdeD (DUF308 family)
MDEYTAMLWKSYSLRGLAAIAAGGVLALWPELVLGVGVIIYGAYSISLGVVDGGLMLFNRGSVERTPLMLGLAVVNIVLGAFLVLHPQRTAQLVLAIAGVFIVVQGLARLVSVLRRHSEGLESWIIGAAGVCEVLVGVAFVARPLIAGVAFVALLGAVLMAFGVASLGAGLAMRAASAASGGPMRPA